MTGEIGPEHVEAAQQALFQRLYGRPQPPRGIRGAELAQLGVSGWLIYNLAVADEAWQRAFLGFLLFMLTLSLGVLWERYR